MKLPDSTRFCIIGAGVHGLSTALHLAQRLKETGQGTAKDIVVLDKSVPGSGASGIACGVVRNFYFSPAMTELVRISVDVWNTDPDGFGFHPVGYIAVVPKRQASDLEAIYKKESEIGYTSELFLGEKDCTAHMRGIFKDFNCDGIEGVLHEQMGGFAYPSRTIAGLKRKVLEEGVEIFEGVEATEFDQSASSVQAVTTNAGTIRADAFLVGGGPWSGRLWKMLGLPLEVQRPDHTGAARTQPLFTYWQLREGSVRTTKPYLADNGEIAPVIHLDHSIPLVDPKTGEVIENGPWGIYWKQEPDGIQGGGVPIPLGANADLEPYGRARKDVDTEFQQYFRAGLAWAQDRFRNGALGPDLDRPNGGIGCFTADNYPIIDFVKSNVLFIADSNHGFKLLGAGKEAASWLMGSRPKSLEPFAFSRFSSGALHPVSQSPFPWN